MMTSRVSLALSVFFFISILTNDLYAQHYEESSEHHDEHQTHEKHEKYKVALTIGYAHIPGAFVEGNREKSVFVPEIGLDFYYHIHPKWSLGLIMDLELAEYIIDFNREDLNRHRALIIAIMGARKITPHLEFLLGGGIELEHHKHLAVIRTGLEYDLKLAKQWSIIPGLFYNFKQEFSGISFNIGIAKKF